MLCLSNNKFMSPSQEFKVFEEFIYDKLASKTIKE